ncbi:hypothetical protein MYX64_12050, partial [Nitrospinae bacterium AH_259_B05_G02_I21]|nr:hypothetical protein [Nitrospinae bacterium AH_259_B05_G02_I21]
MQINQVLAAAHEGDATGDAALTLAAALDEEGHRAGVYALTVDAPLRGRVRRMAELPESGADDTTILHFNVPSLLSAELPTWNGRRLIVYHNLTPPELLIPHCPEIARITALGAEQLRDLAA